MDVLNSPLPVLFRSIPYEYISHTLTIKRTSLFHTSQVSTSEVVVEIDKCVLRCRFTKREKEWYQCPFGDVGKVSLLNKSVLHFHRETRFRCQESVSGGTTVRHL